MCSRHPAVAARAYALEYVGASALQAVIEIGHEGLIKPGWCACAWLRQRARLRLVGDRHSLSSLGRATLNGSTWVSDSAPKDGRQYLNDPRYAWCHRESATSEPSEDARFAHDLRATQGCTCHRCRGACGCRTAGAMNVGVQRSGARASVKRPRRVHLPS